MANDFYNVATDLQPFTRARSGVLDTEFAGIAAGFDKLPSESRVLSGNSNFVTAGGTANAITVSAPTTWTSYTGKDGYKLSIKITTANTSTVTLNVDGLGAKACVRLDGDALEADDLQANGIYDFFYNNSTGKFHVAAWNSFVTAAETAAASAATSESNAATSESNASTSESNASASAATATNYATKTDDYAAGTDNSSKSWAVGGTGNGQPSAGPAKDWAIKAEDSAVDGTNFSALHWSKKAEAWAASVNLPSITGNALKILRAKSDESGHEYVEQPYSQTAADGRFAQLAGGAAANFTAMPQVGGSPIVESGSNSDGEWTRWADGTQHISAQVDNGALSVGAFNTVTYNFPQPFSSGVHGGVSARGMPQDASNWVIYSAEGETVSSTKVVGVTSNATTTSKVTIFYYGRYK